MESSSTLKAPRYRYVICLIIFVSYILVYFHRLCPAVIALDMQKAFDASATLLGLLGSAYFYPYAIMQFPTGLMVDSWGPRKTVASFFLIAAAGSILMGLAPTLTTAVAGRVLVGVGVSTLFVSNFKLLAEWFAPREFVIMGGLFMAMGGIGALSSSAPLAWLSALLGWRMSLVLVGFFTLLMAVLVYAFVRNRPEEKGLPPLLSPTKKDPGKRTGLLAGMKEVALAWRFWPISLWSFFCTGISFALGGLWGGPFLMQVHGMSKTEAGGVLSMFAVALIVGSPLLGILSNRVGRKPIFIGCALLLVLVCATFFLWLDVLPLPLLYMLFFCLSLSGAATGPVVATVSKELFRLDIAGTAIGMVNLFPFLGGALFQVIMGALLEVSIEGWKSGAAGGYQMIFLFALLNAVAGLATACFLTETLPTLHTPRPRPTN